MSCGCHKRSGSMSGHRCSCPRRTHRPACACPEEEPQCVRVDIVISQDVTRRKRKCNRVSPAAEIPVGTINIDCTPAHFESETEVETLVACCVNGFRRPGTQVPFNPTPFIRPVPSKFGAPEVFSTRMETIHTTSM